MQSLVAQSQGRARGVAMKSRGESRRVIHRGRGLQRRGAMSVGDGMRASQEFDVRHALRTKVSRPSVRRASRSEETRWAGDE